MTLETNISEQYYYILFFTIHNLETGIYALRFFIMMLSKSEQEHIVLHRRNMLFVNVLF